MARVFESELSGADWFLVTVERMMRAAGQGEHAGLTVLRVGVGFERERFCSAVERLAAVSPIAAARLEVGWWKVARWRWEERTRAVFPVRQAAAGDGGWAAVGQRLLTTEEPAAVCFEVMEEAEGGFVILMRWRHVLLDGKGAELLLVELARLAEDAAALGREGSWGVVVGTKVVGWRAVLNEAERFKNHFYALTARKIRSLGGPVPGAGEARFWVEEFSVEESERIRERAAGVTQGVFSVGWYLAVAMRAHRRVLLGRGEEAESYQAGCAVQERKRGARHPIWQNQVSQLFFCLGPEELEEVEGAAQRLQEQFNGMSRKRMEVGFSVMARIFRRLPRWGYLRMLRGNSGGHLTSFFFSHTGEFLPECGAFCGGRVEHGWHVPTVSQPPGTGIFFGMREGKMTVTFSWREGVLREGESGVLRRAVREDLLGV